ncbi:MAG TPA: YdeI/OmpD-associated family protein [Candidatus Limnocylindria bacterium]|nr:YdeI/OmpD-associated family protein [Candidatus Limnocylindria bacterium]
MKAKTDARIDAYIAEAGEFARPILRHLRKLVHQGCPAAEETMKWSMPCFQHAGKILCIFGAFKAHCTLGFWHKEMATIVAGEGAKSEAAMGHFGRITSLADLPDDPTLLGYIVQAAKLNESGKPARPRPAARPKTELKVPEDLATLLRKNPPAKAAFSAFSPSHRREYVEWITEAKREETRQKRLATTIEWLAEGKKRNWKYENC